MSGDRFDKLKSYFGKISLMKIEKVLRLHISRFSKSKLFVRVQIEEEELNIKTVFRRGTKTVTWVYLWCRIRGHFRRLFG